MLAQQGKGDRSSARQGAHDDEVVVSGSCSSTMDFPSVPRDGQDDPHSAVEHRPGVRTTSLAEAPDGNVVAAEHRWRGRDFERSTEQQAASRGAGPDVPEKLSPRFAPSVRSHRGA
jgi:hypothetical protein